MRHRHHTGSAAVLLAFTVAVAVSISSCSGTSGGTPSASTTSQIATPESTPSSATPTATPTGSPIASGNFSFEVKTKDGYTGKVSIKSSGLSFVSDITAARPGFTDVKSPLDITVTLANTTPGRKTALPMTPEIYASYPLTSSPCRYIANADGRDWAKQMVSDTHCFIFLDAYLNNPVTIAADSQVNLPALRSLAPKTYPEGTTLIFPGVSEAESTALMDDLEQPIGYLVAWNVDTDVPTPSVDKYGLAPICTTLPYLNVSGQPRVKSFIAASDPKACG